MRVQQERRALIFVHTMKLSSSQSMSGPKGPYHIRLHPRLHGCRCPYIPTKRLPNACSILSNIHAPYFRLDPRTHPVHAITPVFLSIKTSENTLFLHSTVRHSNVLRNFANKCRCANGRASPNTKPRTSEWSFMDFFLCDTANPRQNLPLLFHFGEKRHIHNPITTLNNGHI